VTLHVMVVCTGNICRSPFAAQLLADRLERAGVDATVWSAGTHAMVGHPMPAEAAALSRRAGLDPDAHRGDQLTPTMVDLADLILTASREHRAAVVKMLPRASRRTFTLREFARLAEYVVADHASLGAGAPAVAADPVALVEEVASSRGLAMPPARPEDDDIVDPYRRSPQVYAEAERLITQAVDSAVRAFAATSGPGGRGAA
jgi:protein-tyrosine phosphatase